MSTNDIWDVGGFHGNGTATPWSGHSHRHVDGVHVEPRGPVIDGDD